MPRHVGLIPDGNRRWARERGLPVAAGYMAGVHKGLQMLRDCSDLGMEEVSVYGFTQDNTKRPKDQRIAFAGACVAFVEAALKYDIALLVVGDSTSPMFPEELKPFVSQRQGKGLLVNMVMRWGGCRRLSGFLPVQAVYSEYYVVDEYWPEYEVDQVLAALTWFQSQEQTLGG